MDSSVRLQHNNYTNLFNKLKQNGGTVIMHRTGHSVYAVTHANMYRYLPTDTEALKTLRCSQSTMFVVNTKENCMSVLRWYYLCALTKDCIAPINGLQCSFKGDSHTRFGDCHRFDMSLINLLLGNKFNFTRENFTAQQKNFRLGRKDKINFDKDVLLTSWRKWQITIYNNWD